MNIQHECKNCSMKKYCKEEIDNRKFNKKKKIKIILIIIFFITLVILNILI